MNTQHIMVQTSEMTKACGYGNVFFHPLHSPSLINWQSDLVTSAFKNPNLERMILVYKDNPDGQDSFYVEPEPVAPFLLTWRSVFYTDHKRWGQAAAAAHAVRAGYEYMSWNDQVIELDTMLVIGTIYEIIKEEKSTK